MNRLQSMMIVLMLALSHGLAAEPNDIRMQHETLLLRERLGQGLLAETTAIVPHIKDGTISQKETRVLSGLLDGATRDDLCGKTAIERQQIMVRFLGKSEYETVRSYYAKECQSAALPDARQLAVDMLGHRLFSIESRNILLPFLLSDERQTQFLRSCPFPVSASKGHIDWRTT
ncbi:MAG: hypothetical protein QME60_05645 [Verrucomicrobiota bacterium]|nr:hypothetical protein [Verrucomicrobiota bacterium]